MKTNLRIDRIVKALICAIIEYEKPFEIFEKMHSIESIKCNLVENVGVPSFETFSVPKQSFHRYNNLSHKKNVPNEGLPRKNTFGL